MIRPSRYPEQGLPFLRACRRRRLGSEGIDRNGPDRFQPPGRVGRQVARQARSKIWRRGRFMVGFRAKSGRGGCGPGFYGWPGRAGNGVPSFASSVPTNLLTDQIFSTSTVDILRYNSARLPDFTRNWLRRFVAGLAVEAFSTLMPGS